MSDVHYFDGTTQEPIGTIHVPDLAAGGSPVTLTRTLTIRGVPDGLADRLLQMLADAAPAEHLEVLRLDHPLDTYVVRPRRRRHTQDETLPGGSVRVTMKRACNGCHETLGDAFDDELDAAMAGRPLPDVRGECPRCSPGVRP